MIFDFLDFEFLRLTGFSRYMPAGLWRKYDTPLLKRSVISNLEEHKLIKLLSDKMSYKLTTRGRDYLEKMGYSYAFDARTNLKKKSYIRKLKNAELNILLLLSGIDIYYETARELSDIENGYMSSLTLRSDKNMKVLSGTKFLGVLKIENTAYIPYYIESSESWIFPSFERETFSSQVGAIQGINDIKLILTGEALEELWKFSNSKTERTPLQKGRRFIGEALEEMGYEYLLVPVGKNGVMQMSVLKNKGYRQTLARRMGCTQNTSSALSECDGIMKKSPYVIAIDFNVKRIVRALRQIEKYDKKIIPTVCCLSFQKDAMLKLLTKYGKQKTMVSVIENKDIFRVFPDIKETNIKRTVFITKEGETIEIPERGGGENKAEDIKASDN